VYFILYFQNTFFKYFVIFKILFLKILSAKAKLKANLSVWQYSVLVSQLAICLNWAVHSLHRASLYLLNFRLNVHMLYTGLSLQSPTKNQTDRWSNSLTSKLQPMTNIS